MSSDIAVAARHLTKCFKLYDSRLAFVKETFHPLRKKYHYDFRALDDVSFEIARGETFGVIGKNGSGKSTLLKILSGVLTPTTGTVNVNGKLSALLELGAGFNPELTGIENVYFNGTLLGLSRKEIDSRLDEVLAFADIGEYVHQSVKSYSSGMFVRLAFALATIVEPEILIVDEALSVGDIFFQQKCYKRLDALKQQGVTIILVTHNMSDVLQHCQRAILLHAGRIQFMGAAPDTVKQYFLLEQQEKLLAYSRNVINRKGLPPQEASLDTASHFDWPDAEAFFDISKVKENSNGWARCTGVALCNEHGESVRVFYQGEVASFFYEFEVIEDIEVPIGGLMIYNEKSVMVHGKSSLEHGAHSPNSVRKGNKIRFRQDVKLDIGLGMYSFDLGLATINEVDFKNKALIPYSELISRTIRVCHLSSVGSFTVGLTPEGLPVQFLHHGVCNLLGGCEIDVVEGTTMHLQMIEPDEQ